MGGGSGSGGGAIDLAKELIGGTGLNFTGPAGAGAAGASGGSSTASPPVVPPTTPLPGFSGPGIPLFGRLSPEQLAAFNAQHGTAPVRPPAMTNRPGGGKASGLFTPKPKPYVDDGRGP